VEADAELLRAFISQGTDVDVLLKATFLCHLYGELAEVINGVGQVNLQHTAALEQALVMLLDTEEVKLLMVVIPVAADALKDGSAIVQEVGHNAQFGFRERDEFLLKVSI
jgi:hypothetical protein